MKKLNSKAFSQVELIIVVAVLFVLGGVGYAVFKRSSSNVAHAGSAYTTLANVNVNALGCYNKATNTTQALVGQTTGSLNPQSFVVSVNNTTTGGGISQNPGQTAPVVLYAEPSDSLQFAVTHYNPNLTAIQQSGYNTNLSTQAIKASNLAACSSDVAVTNWAGSLYTVTGINISSTFSRATYGAGNSLFISKTDGTTIMNSSGKVGGFEVKNLSGTAGMGLYTASGGVQPNGGKVLSQLYINSNQRNGVYYGSSRILVQNYATGQFTNGPIVNYTITLTN